LAVRMGLGRILAPFRHARRIEIHRRDMRCAGLAVEQGDGGPPRQRGSRLPSEDVGLDRFFELDVRKSRVRAEPLFLPQYFGRQRDFGLAERVERMTGIHAGSWLCAYHIGPNSPGIWPQATAARGAAS